MNFLRNLLASIIGSLVAFGVLFIMFFIFVSLVGSVEEGIVVKKNSILELQLQDPINDYVGNDELDPFDGLFERAQGLDEILHAIRVAKNDDNINGISINNNFLVAGLSQTQAIGVLPGKNGPGTGPRNCVDHKPFLFQNLQNTQVSETACPTTPQSKTNAFTG